MDSFLVIISIIAIVVIAWIVIGMFTFKVSLGPSRWTAAILLGVNIMFFAFYASLSANWWHDPRIPCGNGGLVFLFIGLVWCPFILALAGVAIWWIICELKEPGNRYAIIKVLVPCILTALCVEVITKVTIDNPNSYSNEMQRKYDAGLLDDEGEWDDEDSVATDQSIRVDSDEATPDTIINP